MASRRYIEITSTNRNRKQWPCPSEFIVPVDCRNRSETPLEAQDPIALGYPEKGWYAVPQTTPNDGNIPRNINGLYYGSLWPLSPDLALISAMHFSGGNYNAPHLNAVVTQPGNVWSATTGMISYNPYYTPKKNYFSGALLIRFAPVPPNTVAAPVGWPSLAGIGSSDPSVLLNIPTVQKLTVNTGFTTLIKIGDRVIQGATQGVVVCVEDPVTFYIGIIAGSFVITTPITSNEVVEVVIPTSVSAVESGARYCGQVETSIIKSYNQLSGAVELLHPLGEDFSFQDDYYLIDFFSDPENGFSSYFSEGARIFIPNGSTSPQAYEGMIIENYTLSSSYSKVIYSIVKSYDFIRRVALLETILPLSTLESPDTTTVPISTIKSHGSDSFFLRHKPELAIKAYERIAVTEGSVLNIDILDGGSGYRIGETIGSPSETTTYYSAPATIFNYPAANYVFMTRTGRGFRGEITSVSTTGGILSINVIQQGQGYQRGTSMSLVVNGGSGTDCLLTLPNVYQAIEVYRKNDSDGINNFGDGNFVFLPSFGQIKTSGLTNTDKQSGAPQLPRYQYLPPSGYPPTSLQSTNILDIRQSGYPVRLNGCVSTNNFNIPETGIRQIVSTINKDITFGDWMVGSWTDIGFGNSTTVTFPTSVIYLSSYYNFSNAGLTDNGIPVVVNNTSPLTSSSYLQQQNLEFLEYSSDNAHPLNFTGTRVGQNQMVCYEIKLISITIPNVPLDNEIGGLVAFYPYFYIELSNVNAPMRGNKGVLYSNNPHANRALFRVDIRDTNTPLRSKFIKLRGGGTQTVKFRPNDDLYFRVFLNNGQLFETVAKDTSPPLPPDFFVQISAQFQIQMMV
tara:strand:+ start:1573 stop:4119 length:2547 start_codon:yes stop_codon:yes gene_type:complete